MKRILTVPLIQVTVCEDDTSQGESANKEQLLIISQYKVRLKPVTKADKGFVLKDVQPWATMEDTGFQRMMEVLEWLRNSPSDNTSATI